MIDKRARRNQEAITVDNYEEFKKRLTNAANDLKKRKSNVARHVSLLEVMLDQNRSALLSWSDQYKYAYSIQANYSGEADGYRIISDLVETSSRMKSLFAKRVNVLNEKSEAAQENLEAITKAIGDLDSSFAKLDFSKMLNDDKARLLATESALSGSPALAGGSHVMSQELHNAREAVAMAEALLELKGH